ncbi:MAG: protein phosphatase 2C domain-containing protein, partial [archaeon]|nr:protein phosphatase 2C domain-containing protein [archaeon]
GIGDWAQSPIPNPQSPIPTKNMFKDLNININTNINIHTPILGTNINQNSIQNNNISKTIPNENNIDPSNDDMPLLTEGIQGDDEEENLIEGDGHQQEPEIISINSLFNNQEIPIGIQNLYEEFPGYEKAKYSTKDIGNIKGYGANTYQGIVRNYNEDRVSIILNIAKPSNYEGEWPKCSLFGIYDGHGGNACADFLRDKLHTFIIKDSNFTKNPQKALIKGFAKAEEYFINNFAIQKTPIEKKGNELNLNDSNYEYTLFDKSGSCAIVALIVENICYVANVGDSRGLISLKGGKKLKVLSTDHKPNEEHESQRIISNGGKIYQTKTPTKFFTGEDAVENAVPQILLGPYRVFPGRLSVSRTIGDVEAKIPQFGGLPGVVIAEPEITYFNIEDDIDFLMLGCDGIFDQLSNEEIVDSAWMCCDYNKERDYQIVRNVHEQCMVSVDMIMKNSLVRKTLDNITVVIVAFKNFEKEVNKRLKLNQKISTEISDLSNDSFGNERLATEPCYNFQQEKIRVKSGLKMKSDLSGNGREFEKNLRKLSPSHPNKLSSMEFKGINNYGYAGKRNILNLMMNNKKNQSKLPITPKMAVKRSLNYSTKK